MIAMPPRHPGCRNLDAEGRLDPVWQDGFRSRQAIARLPGRLSLRVRLVATTLCLVAAGAAIIGAATGLVARDYLMRQADQQLRAYADRLTSRPFRATPISGLAPGGWRPGGSGGGAFTIEVRGSAGQLVMRAGTGTQPGPASPAPRARIAARAGQLVTVPAVSGGGSWRVIAEPVHYRARRIPYAYSAQDFSLLVTSTARPGLAGTLVAGLDLGSIGQGIRRLAITCLAVSGVVLLVVACLGAVVIRSIVRPLTRMQQTAAAVAAGELSRRVPEGHPRSDTGRLARSVNTMLSQIEHAFTSSAAAESAARTSTARTRQIIAETARELRTPLSVIRGLAQHHRQRGQLSAAELDRMIRRLEYETARIGVLAGHLLPARHDQQHPPQR
jgi:HAMP domain-containing protein